MDQKRLRQLAEGGGICHKCGGVHTPKVDQAILAAAAGLPVCDCSCAICAKFHAAVSEVMRPETGMEDQYGEQTDQ
jgi:hypothetical protein